MGNVLGQLTFQASLLFFLRDIDDGYLKRHILENNTFQSETARILVDMQGIAFLFFVRVTFIPVQKFRDRFQFRNVENLIGGTQVPVRNVVDVLCEQVIDQNLLSFLGENTQSLV